MIVEEQTDNQKVTPISEIFNDEKIVILSSLESLEGSMNRNLDTEEDEAVVSSAIDSTKKNQLQ